MITQDALPFVKTVGLKPACYGLNRIGLERKGVAAETIERLEAAVRRLTALAAAAGRGARGAARGARATTPTSPTWSTSSTRRSAAVIRALPGRKASNRGG